MEYSFTEIEQKWQRYWAEHKTFKAHNQSQKPKFYVLDMFPYPSGAGLHVGHPLGYIASDIFARFKRHQGHNVLHPMGYDAFGLPAEQYAIQTGQHPQITTEQNIKRYREQLDKIGFSFDWDRQVITSDPSFYRWTQWIFIQLFNSWYNRQSDKAEPIETLITHLNTAGTHGLNSATHASEEFDASQWRSMDSDAQQRYLLQHRLAYLAETTVNWCEALGTVLANDEVVNGVSERGGHPVEHRKMTQWSLRITAYAQRLLDDLAKVEYPDSLKETQRNWIGRSEGAELNFTTKTGQIITVFTTRPDTLFGCSFLVLAPEHSLVDEITTAEQKSTIAEYRHYCDTRSDRERLADVNNATGAFTGGYAAHPITRALLPIYISDYVLAGYGTGAIMAVPAGDERDWRFAKALNLPIPSIIEEHDAETAPCESYDAVICNSGFLNGMNVKTAAQAMLAEISRLGIGKGRVQFKLHDAVFSRQRYWGEPFPIYYCDGIPHAMHESQLPLVLPQIDQFKPTSTGEPPLGRAINWHTSEGWLLELNTMPGWAGSSWYFLRYMDPHNTERFASAEAINYWQQVDLYVGGAEHSTGHLLYFRFWTKFLFDRGFLPFDEPVKKLLNQGMILGENHEKMSKSRGNVVNPDDVISEHGADALRLHEMFLGPIEMHKPWNTKGIDGVSRFLRKLWRLYHEGEAFHVSEEEPTRDELKVLHRAIQKTTADMHQFSFNTTVSALMIAVNELYDLECRKRAILEPLAVLVSCHAPHIAEELWQKMGHQRSISEAPWPTLNEQLLESDLIEYPVSINGKTRFHLAISSAASAAEVEATVLANEQSKKWIEQRIIKKVIVVPKRIVNVVVQE